jgi:Tfp pilus assembly protein PilV
MKRIRSKRGQTMVEYIIIVVVIAIAGLVLFGLFGDTLRKKMSGAVSSLDSGQQASDAQQAASGSSADWLRNMDETGSSSP